MEGSAGVPVSPEDLEPDRLALILGIGDAEATGPRGLLFQAHNKIKHRFMVIEDIATVGATPGDPVRLGHLPRDQAIVMRLVDNIAQVALSTGELAALLLTLDQTARAGAESRSQARAVVGPPVAAERVGPLHPRRGPSGAPRRPHHGNIV
jgi:hypothetical protein